MERREFLEMSAAAVAAMLLAPRTGAGMGEVQLEEATLESLQAAMQSGAATSRSLTEGYLARIASIDKSLNSVIELNPDALAAADQRDLARKTAKRIFSPLHGIPVLIKDNIDTGDRMKTTAGSLALLDAPTPKDAFIVKQLQYAGAVILGKTNLSEWANFRSTHSSSGWSARGGQTHNPYILDRNPCGSSAGSGAAVAASLAAVAVGTETDGSIICPSTTCGIVGIKPTIGQVSRTGIIPIAHSQDTAGPMCRSVADAAALLTILIGADNDDPSTRVPERPVRRDHRAFLRKDGLKGKRIGVARQYFGRNDKVDKVIEPLLRVLKEGGATLFDVTFPKLQDFGDAEYEVLLYEFKADLNKYLEARGGRHKTLADLIEFNNKNADREMQYFGQEIFLAAQKKGDLNETAYKKALAQCKQMSQAEGIDAIMDKDKLDAVVAPSGGTAWMTDLVGGDCGVFESSSLAAVAGYPNITVPAGYVQGLPVGISFFGKAWTEGKLIEAAYAFEQATMIRKPPRFLPTYTG